MSTSIDIHPDNQHSQPAIQLKEDTLTEEMLLCIRHTLLFQHLRNNYQHFKLYHKHQLRHIVKNGEFFRIKNQNTTIIINFNQPTICVIIFGNILVNNKRYKTGDFLTINEIKSQIQFLNKTTMIMLNKVQLEEKIKELQTKYCRKSILQNIFPVALLGLNREQIESLAGVLKEKFGAQGEIINRQHIPQGKNEVQANQEHEQSRIDISLTSNKSTSKIPQKSIYILKEGNYSLLNTTQHLKILQITNDIFGQQILFQQNYQYHLQNNNTSCLYYFISKKNMLKVLTHQQINKMKSVYCQKLKIRKNIENNLKFNINYAKQYFKNYKNKNHQKSREDKLEEERFYQNRSNLLREQFQEKFGLFVKKKYSRQLILNRKQSGKFVAKSEIVVSSDVKVKYQQMMREQRVKTQNKQAASLLEATSEAYKSPRKQDKDVLTQRHKMYREQRSKSSHIFRKKAKTELNQKQAERKWLKTAQLSERQVVQLRNLPKTLSVLLNYYESYQKIKSQHSQAIQKCRSSPKNRPNPPKKGFIGNIKERRMITTQKLHKDIFLQQYYDIKSIQDRAFKTWR